MQHKIIYRNIKPSTETKHIAKTKLDDLIKKHSKNDDGRLKLEFAEFSNQRSKRIECRVTSKNFKFTASAPTLDESIDQVVNKVDALIENRLTD